jgi:DNA-directed RNA polymerase specialized sigma24 family protein
MTSTIADIDTALVTLAADGDSRAVAEFVRALERPILGIALRMLLDRDDAADATQETLVRIVTRLAQFAPSSNLARRTNDRAHHLSR